MLKYLISLILLIATPAIAQQQSISTVPETAVQINTIIGSWSQTLTQQAKLIEQLQKENADLKKQLEEKDKK